MEDGRKIHRARHLSETRTGRAVVDPGDTTRQGVEAQSSLVNGRQGKGRFSTSQAFKAAAVFEGRPRVLCIQRFRHKVTLLTNRWSERG